eukprot:3039812-Rhodomonas_salina.2
MCAGTPAGVRRDRAGRVQVQGDSGVVSEAARVVCRDEEERTLRGSACGRSVVMSDDDDDVTFQAVM